MRLVADVFRGTITTSNVLAESSEGAPDNVVMAGAHLDSVWGAREAGLRGSDYQGFASGAAVGDIALYLNFDMIASPNLPYSVYDGDGSEFGLADPEGSAAIEDLFESYCASLGLPYEPTEISFTSDYAVFFDLGIPFGGLFTGAEVLKTADQAVRYGGIAGEPFDPCYHLACDTFDNVSLAALEVNSDAVATAVLEFAMSTESVNGRRGKDNFSPKMGGPPLGAGPTRGERVAC